MFERKEESENYFNNEELQDISCWKDILGIKFNRGVIKIISTLGVEGEPSLETLEQPFCEKTQSSLKAGKVTSTCNTSVKNLMMGAWWAMMNRKKEELISHELHTKEWNFNTSKIAEVVTSLDLIATLRAKARSTNQVKVEVCMDNEEI